DVDEIYATNIVGTRHLLQALVDENVAPTSVLLASSANVYGNQQGGMIGETAAPHPANDYAVSKLAMEYVAHLYATRLPIIITRPFNYTGVGQSPSFLIPKIVEHVRRRAPEIELGNLDVARDFSDVRSVVDAYARLLTAPGAVGGTFNICSGQAYPLRQVLDLCERITGHAMRIRVNPAFARANEVRTLCGDKTHLEQVIGPVAMPPLEETLRWMLQA
ncbi:MAG: GDP-mannose 4,6-dehydratase, partial [Methylacidiphilaceae bacterium]|nr:GDP-mannose 4,6-dehydratase [Candidatus Methylacidiphilaceae bacterium]